LDEHITVVDKLVKIYGGSVRALNGISFKVDRVSIIDKGYIIAEGSVSDIIASQGARNLEEAFLKLVSR